MTLTAANVIELYSSSKTIGPNELEWSTFQVLHSQAGLSRKYYTGWKGSTGTNNQAHFATVHVTTKDSFITLTPVANVIKLFTALSYDFS